MFFDGFIIMVVGIPIRIATQKHIGKRVQELVHCMPPGHSLLMRTKQVSQGLCILARLQDNE